MYNWLCDLNTIVLIIIIIYIIGYYLKKNILLIITIISDIFGANAWWPLKYRYLFIGIIFKIYNLIPTYIIRYNIKG